MLPNRLPPILQGSVLHPRLNPPGPVPPKTVGHSGLSIRAVYLSDDIVLVPGYSGSETELNPAYLNILTKLSPAYKSTETVAGPAHQADDIKVLP